MAMTDRIEFVVLGVPAPQGSKTGIPIYRGRGPTKVFTGKVAMIESSKKVAPWRAAVKAAAIAAMTEARHPGFPSGPVRVSIVFGISKPYGEPYGTLPDRNPDLDKLLRSTLDALTMAKMYRDDGQVVSLRIDEDWADPPGAKIRVERRNPLG